MPMSQVKSAVSALYPIPDIIFYKDTQGVYRGGNPAWATLLGQPLDQPMANHIGRFRHNAMTIIPSAMG